MADRPGQTDTEKIRELEAQVSLLLQGQAGGLGGIGGLPGLPQPGSTSARQLLLGAGARDFGTGASVLGADRRQQQFFLDPLTGQVPGSQAFAPTTQFTGGSPFEVDDTAQIFQNLLLIMSSPLGKKLLGGLGGLFSPQGAPGIPGGPVNAPVSPTFGGGGGTGGFGRIGG